MAIPLPSATNFVPVVAGLGPWEDRGSFELTLPTKSTRSTPSVFVSADVCDQDNLIRGQISATVNELIDCEIVQAGNISISISVPYDESTSGNVANNVDALIALVSAKLKVAMGGLAAA